MVGTPTPKVVRYGRGTTFPPATTDDESHIKAPPSTSEVARPSEVGSGRVRTPTPEAVRRGQDSCVLSGGVQGQQGITAPTATLPGVRVPGVSVGDCPGHYSPVCGFRPWLEWTSVTFATLGTTVLPTASHPRKVGRSKARWIAPDTIGKERLFGIAHFASLAVDPVGNRAAEPGAVRWLAVG